MADVDIDKFYKVSVGIIAFLSLPIQGWLLVHANASDIQQVKIQTELVEHRNIEKHSGAIGSQVLDERFKNMSNDITEIKADLKEIKKLVR